MYLLQRCFRGFTRTCKSKRHCPVQQSAFSNLFKFGGERGAQLNKTTVVQQTVQSCDFNYIYCMHKCTPTVPIAVVAGLLNVEQTNQKYRWSFSFKSLKKTTIISCPKIPYRRELSRILFDWFVPAGGGILCRAYSNYICLLCRCRPHTSLRWVSLDTVALFVGFRVPREHNGRRCIVQSCTRKYASVPSPEYCSDSYFVRFLHAYHTHCCSKVEVLASTDHLHPFRPDPSQKQRLALLK